MKLHRTDCWAGSIWLLLACECLAQSPTRTEEIERAVAQKAERLAPEVRSAGEQKFLDITSGPWVKTLLAPGGTGVRLGFGGMAPGAGGFAIGPDWKRADLLGERLQIAASARASANQSYLGVVSVALPELFDGKAALRFSAAHRNFAAMPFYGVGPDSAKTGRSAYRLEDSTLEVRPGLRAGRHLEAGLIGGWYAANAGPGDTSTFISAEKQYEPDVAPGIDRQGSFVRSGAYAVYDRRGFGTEPASGFRYAAERVRMSDRDYGAYSHGRLDFDVQHYFSFFNERRVIALHGHTTLTDVRRDQAIPFYMQPSLGGPDTLRGFRPFRFTGPNNMWINAEYRWEASAALDVVAFADGGKVYDRWERLNFHDLETSAGFGFRFKRRQNVALRIDTGFSHEGVQLWIRFDNVF